MVFYAAARMRLPALRCNNDMRKNALLVTLDFPPAVGGVAAYLLSLARVFPSGRLTVLAPKSVGSEEIDRTAPVPIWRRRLLTPWLRPRWLAALFLPMGEVALLLKLFRRLPYTVIVHGFDIGLVLSGGFFKRRIGECILRHADTVVVNSAHTAVLACSLGASAKQIVTLYPSPKFDFSHGPDLEERGKVRSRLGLAADDYVLLTVGRLVERKGFGDTVRGLAEGLKVAPRLRLVVAGDGPERISLEKLATELSVSERVTFVERPDDEALMGLYRASDAFIMLPRAIGPDVGGFGIVYVEAGLFGLPVIATRSGGVPDAVLHDRTGLLVLPGDIPAIKNAMKRLYYEDGLAKKLGEQGRQRVLQEFGWERQSRELVARIFSEPKCQRHD